MDFIQLIWDYIIDKALILVPALYILGMVLKQMQFIADKYIPLILIIVGVGFAVWMLGFSPDSVIQGILVAGAAVIGNQLFKQMLKKD